MFKIWDHVIISKICTCCSRLRTRRLGDAPQIPTGQSGGALQSNTFYPGGNQADIQGIQSGVSNRSGQGGNLQDDLCPVLSTRW